MHAGEEDHARPGRTTSRRGQDSPWKSVRMTEDRDKWRKYVHGVANPRIDNGQRTEHTCHMRAERCGGELLIMMHCSWPANLRRLLYLV